jgi:hypothetical protein
MLPAPLSNAFAIARDVMPSSAASPSIIQRLWSTRKRGEPKASRAS